MIWFFLPSIIFLLHLSGCTNAAEVDTADSGAANVLEGDDHAEVLVLPQMGALELDGGPLRVVATTSIIGDVVAQVGGDAIQLTTMMAPGQDPHSYRPAARDLTAVSEAHVIFVNGWDLEEGLVADVVAIAGAAPIVPISAGIAPLARGAAAEHAEETEHEAEGVADPHVWFDVRNVAQWTTNVETMLSVLDPQNEPTYQANAAAYLSQLRELQSYMDRRLNEIPQANRQLVTNHDSLNYFANAYGFTVLDTVIPAASTLAEPSAADLATLIATMAEHDVCAIFSETTSSDRLAQTVSAELNNCDSVQVLPLYTGAVGSRGSGAESYIGMMRSNVDMIVEGLK